ncbi:MAG: AMP phosphorylase [Candidatus Bathyarchaeota archaeon]|nr:AMP phosphorylase [Candidatus Bathyarchaeota archaeon]MDH5687370.1 AMP phosphorylase [Candidatus Bathyarchaeota archaeon]
MMKLKVRLLGFEAGGKSVVVLNKSDAEDLGISSLGRVRVNSGEKELTAIVNTTSRLIGEGIIGVYEEVRNSLSLDEGVHVDVEIAPFPTSVYFIRNKLRGRKLTYEEVFEIVKDVVEGNLSEIEIAAFVTALHTFGLDLDEATNISSAMVETGNVLKLERTQVVDKHSIGGVPGDKTTLLVVPIIAACGLTIPKSSSRAITSAAGTADRTEVLMPVNLNIDAMREVVEKTGGCIVWGGSLYLAPADDIFVRVEHPLSIDPLLLPSIMSKKKAVGTNLLVVDIPCGRGTKVKTIGEADLLAKDFIELGRRLDIQVQCAITYGEQPVGYTIGPSLEAREALSVLSGEGEILDLIDKATDIAGILLDMSGKKNGKEMAVEALTSGKAERKMREIIEAQGGDPDVKPDDIPLGDQRSTVNANREGYILWIDNTPLVEVARLAGAPKDKGAGLVLHRKIGDRVRKGEPLFTIYAERSTKLQRALDELDKVDLIGVAERMEMLIHEVKERPITRKAFMLER